MSPFAVPPPSRAVHDDAVYAIDRPHSRLWTYYLLCCIPFLLFPPVALLVGMVNWFRYQTMRYRFDAEGINMRWGILFRREIILNFARIQDIHLVSNFVERWLGLARIQIQTASGSASPEMTLEGILEFEHLRDFLYAKMRGIKDSPTRTGDRTGFVPANRSSPSQEADAELATILRSVAQELRALRQDLAQRRANPPRS